VEVILRKITTRTVEGREHLKQIALGELERVSQMDDVDLAFIVPSATVIAEKEEEREFAQKAQHELGKWHHWLSSVFFGSGNVRRWKKTVSAEDHCIFIAGIFICDNSVSSFAQFEKQFKVRKQRGRSPKTR
jgi:hypothetical protein